MHQIIIANTAREGRHIRGNLMAAGIEIPARDVYSAQSPQALYGLLFDVAYVAVDITRMSPLGRSLAAQTRYGLRRAELQWHAKIVELAPR